MYKLEFIGLCEVNQPFGFGDIAHFRQGKMFAPPSTKSLLIRKYLQVYFQFNPGEALYLGGSSEPCAIITSNLYFGVEKIQPVLMKHLGLPPNRMSFLYCNNER